MLAEEKIKPKKLFGALVLLSTALPSFPQGQAFKGVGLEKFWSELCDCYLWQVSGIAGAHTRVMRFYKNAGGSRLGLIPGGEFGSEIGSISRVSQKSGFIVEVRDSDVAAKRKTWGRYRFNGKKFERLRTQ